MSSRCDFKTRFCSSEVFNMLKQLYDQSIRKLKKNCCSALEDFENIAEGTIRPQIIELLTPVIMTEKRLSEAQARRSVDQLWKSCKGSLYEYAVCRALDEVLANNPSLAEKLEIVHGSNLSSSIRNQLVIKNWSDILPDADFVIVNKACNKAVAVLSCKTSLRERLTETAFWARELRPKGIDVVFVTADRDGEMATDVNRYIVMHILDYTVITDPSRYSYIVSEWSRKYGSKPDFNIMMRKVVSFKNITTLLQQYAIKC